MSNMQKISELLNQFGISIELPGTVLELEVKGDFTGYRTDKMVLEFINNSAQLDTGKFECYIFEGEDCQCIIAPTNKFKMVSAYHKINEIFVGCSYGFDGSVTART